MKINENGDSFIFSRAFNQVYLANVDESSQKVAISYSHKSKKVF